MRGEVIRVHAPEVTLERPTRLIHPRYSLYIAPEEDRVFVIGATEIESSYAGHGQPALDDGAAQRPLHRSTAGFAEARILELANHRPAPHPARQPARPALGGRAVLQVNGLYRHGFMISPTMHEITLQVLADGTSPPAAQMQVPVLQG